MKFQLLFNTVRFLKPIQIWGRLLHSLPRMPLRNVKCPAVNTRFKLNGEINKQNSTSDGHTFTFLSESSSVSQGWNNERLSLLWRYNLHYFDFLNQQDSLDKKLAKDLILQWIQSNPIGSKCGWDPYPTSLRIINWVKWLSKNETLDSFIISSLWTQLRWLAQRPEYHLLGNHLFINAKAMVMGGSYFKGAQAEKIVAKGLQILQQELDEQFLQDGAQFELTPMYHALAMEDLLELYGCLHNQHHLDLNDKLKEKIQQGMQWLSSMTYDNGQYAHFNDCAQGIAPTFVQLQSLAQQLGIELNSDTQGLNYFKDSGYVVYAKNDMKFIADLAKVGPDYLPGHAHADTLSFELAFGMHRVVVNHGVTCYGTGPQRQIERGTKAHSTVTINNENSSEVWGGFRVARRAYPFDISVVEDMSCVKIQGSHNGYHRLKGSPTHTRSWLIVGNQVSVIDKVQGEHQSAIAKYLIHPDVNIILKHRKKIIFQLKDSKIISFQSDHTIKLVQSTYSVGFGRLENTKHLEITFSTSCQIDIKQEYM